MTEQTVTPTPDLTQKPDATLLTGGEQKTTPVAAAEFVPDPTKSEAENATAKTAFEAAATEAKRVADEKAAAENKTKAEQETAAKANDTKLNPMKLDEIKVPEGLEVDETVAKPFVEIVNKFGLGRDAVAELVTLQANAMKAASEKSTQVWTKMQEDWTAAVKADPDIGGEKLAPALGQIAKLIDHYKIPELRAAFDLTGAGNNPHVIKFLSKIANDLGESHFVAPNSPSGGAKTAAEILYPNQKT